MLPGQFWNLTPAQFNALSDGYYRRRRAQLERDANWVCVIVNSMPMRGRNAKTLRAEQLIGFSDEQKKELERRRQEARAKLKSET